ncbi:hypothetical protein [Clostridium sp. JS66]|uniref:hypothetical protein n=1 Tax=Clostridium sp. JS66 TaxID=3064705 RepID=UPI00298D9525|nr:hypothetical protein [Clostridium sp. JS66]WPC39928.1 hypothetical protein Q6H37_18705 [Clostridium sp. JS66]
MVKSSSKNNHQNKKMKAITNIFIIILVVIIFFISMQMLEFICYFRTKLNKAPNLIFVTPGDISVMISPLVFFMFSFIFILFIILCIRVFLDKEKFICIKNNFMAAKSIKGIIVYIVILLGLFYICVDYSVIYKDKIFYRSVVNILGKYYGYSDIKKVRVSEVKDSLYYCLIMRDGTEINLTSIKTNCKFIPEVESHIGNRVPNVVPKVYKKVLNKNYFPYYISEKFQIID